MLDKRDEPQLMDFGLAKRMDDDSSNTIDGSLLGTPAYMAPEQARGDHSQVGPHSDQYSLGAVLYELLTQTKPFEGPPHLILAKVLDEDPAPIATLRPDVPRDLVAICEKAMGKDKAARYESCHAFADDLERWIHGDVTLARPISRAEKVQRWIRRNPRVTVAFSTALLAIGLAAAVSIVFAAYASRTASRESQAAEVLRQEQERTKLALTKAEQESSRATEAQQLAEKERTAADEARQRAEDQAVALRATLARSNFQNGVSLYDIGDVDAALESLKQAAEMIEPESPLAIGYRRVLVDRVLRGGSLLTPPLRGDSVWRQGFFTKDGSRCVTAGAGGTTQIWEVATGEPVGAPFKTATSVDQVSIDRSESQLLTVCRDGSVHLWKMDEREQSLSLLPATGTPACGIFSPDGRSVVTGDSTGALRRWKLPRERSKAKASGIRQRFRRWRFLLMASGWRSVPSMDF